MPSAGSASPASGVSTGRSSSTTGSSTATPSRFSNAAERFLRETLPIAGRIEAGRLDRIDEPLYPTLAMREALANAVCHRDYAIGGGSVGVAVYDDRLEVTSSGTLHFGLTPEKLFAPHESLPWNPLIARTFYRRGLIEEWGRGTLKMAEATASAGLPHPEIEDAGGCVTVRFRRGTPAAGRVGGLGAADGSSRAPSGQRGTVDRDDRLRAILAVLDRRDSRWRCARSGPVWRSRPTNAACGRILASLKARGLIAPAGHGRGARWKRL